MIEFNHIFRLDGVPHDRDSLSALCALELERKETEPWRRELCSFLLSWIDPEVTEFEQLTSGTTGRPRRYMLDRDAMIRSATNTLSHFNLQPGSGALLCLPVRYIAGKMMAVRALVGQLDLVTVEPSGRPLKGLVDPLDFAAMVPLQVHESLRHGDNLSIIRNLVIGGGEIHHTLREQMEAMERPAIHESFAMTETYTHFAFRRINGRGAGSYFHPMPGVKLELDSRGCLVVWIPGVTEEPVVTNDLVEMDSDSHSFRWLGRVDHVISSGGIKLIPESVEEKIRPLVGTECLVLPEKDVRLGTRLVLMVETEDPVPPIEQWMQSFRRLLPAHEVPKRIVTVRNIPRNPSFKPDRTAALRLLEID